MEIVVHLLYRRDDDIRRQNAGQGSAEGVRWMVKFSAKAGDLAKGVDTGIRSARAHHMDVLPDNPRNSSLQRSLNGQHARLNLPAMIVGPIVFDRQFKRRHCRPERRIGAPTLRSSLRIVCEDQWGPVKGSD
jgi:hypothetical protein